MAGQLYHPVALFPTADKSGGQGKAPDVRCAGGAKCGIGVLELLCSAAGPWGPSLWFGWITPITYEVIAARGERNGGRPEESVLFPPVKEKKYYQCHGVVMK